MSSVDKLKEKIAYLKLWLGIFIVTDISLIGWLVSAHQTKPVFLVYSGLVASTALSIAIFLLHFLIGKLINQLEAL